MAAEQFKPLTEREMDYMVRQTSGVRNHFDFGYIQDATKDKGACVTANVSKGVPYNVCCEPVRIGTYPDADGTLKNSQGMRIYGTDGKSVTLCGNGGGKGAKTGLYGVPICHTIPQEVRVRKYTCDLEEFQSLLRESKKASKLTNSQIAELLGRPNTEVDHWFRTDKCFSVPDENIWFDLKALLNIESTEFDDFVTVFEERDGVFDKSNRCYDVNGKMSTLMTGKTDNIIAPSNQAAQSTCPDMRAPEATIKGYVDIEPGDCVDLTMPNSKTRRGRSMKEKSYCLMTGCQYYQYIGTVKYPIYEVRDGMITIKGKQYPIKLVDGFYIIRKLTVNECKRLQTVPESYEFPVSDTQAYKMLGNGWTVEVIAHLINATQNTEPYDLFSMAGDYLCCTG
jgi:hypothetical protein